MQVPTKRPILLAGLSVPMRPADGWFASCCPMVIFLQPVTADGAFARERLR